MKKNIAHCQYLIVFFVALLFFSNKSKAQENKKTFSSDFPYEILENNSSLEPKVENFLRFPEKFNFRFLKSGNGISLIPNQTYWIRFKVKPMNGNNFWIIETYNMLTINLYKPQNNTYKKHEFYPSKPIISRDLFTLKNVFLVESNPNLWYYGEVTTNEISGLGFTILSIKDYIYYSTVENILLVIFFSLIVFLIFVTLILYIRMQKKVFLYFLLFLLANLFYYTTNIGLIYSFFNISKVDYRLFTIFYAFITVSFLMYSQSFLSINKTPVKGLNFISKLVWIRFIILFLSMFENLSFLRSANIDLILLLYCIFPTYFAIKSGIKSAYFYAISLFIILLSYSFHSFMSETYNSTFLSYFASRILSFSANYVQIFAFIQILFFTYALIERYVEIKKENEFKSENEIKVQKFLNEEMSFIVKLKTKELEIANQQIQESADKILEMNKLLQSDNENLVRDVELLKKARFIDQNLNFLEFKNTFTTDEIAYTFLAQLKWKNGYHCKKCNYNKFYTLEHLSSRKCKLCGFSESAISDTLLDNIHFSSVKALYIVYLTYHLPKINISGLAKEIDMRVATCSVFYNKVKNIIENEVKTKKMKIGESDQDNSWIRILV